MTIEPNEFMRAIKAKNAISAADTLALRKVIWPDGRISEAEADILFELNNIGGMMSTEWEDFFCEAVSIYVVDQVEPRGYVTQQNADWIIQKIDHDGKIETRGELELLAKIVEKADNTPDSFKDYVLKQIEQIVTTGRGPTRGGDVRPGCVTKAEADYLRRIIFASGGDGPARVSRNEAEMLFRVKDATISADNAPEWGTLFVQGVANHLMAHDDFQPLMRGDAVQLEAFMDDNQPSVGSFFGRMVKSDISQAFGDVFGRKKSAPLHADKVAEDMAITQNESDWLQARIDADQKIDPLEKRLLKFIAEESA